jgi:hypothetical protein
MEKGYIKTYNWVKGLLNDCDFSDSSKRLGLEQISENTIVTNFFDRTYKITHKNIELIQQKTMWIAASEAYEFNLKSILGYYVLSKANIEPMYEYCALGQFSSGVFRESSSWLTELNNKFSHAFGNNYEHFAEIMKQLGLEYENGNRDGKYIWNFKLLPKIPIKLVFYEGDDEYPSKMQILYDKNAIKIYNFEQLAILYECIFHTILAVGEKSN